MTMKITTDRRRKTEKSHLLYTSVVIRIVSEWLKPSLLCRRCIRCYGLRFTQTESFITKCTKIYLIDFCSYFVVIKYNDDATVDTHVDNHLTRSHYLTVFHFTRSTISQKFVQFRNLFVQQLLCYFKVGQVIPKL